MPDPQQPSSLLTDPTAGAPMPPAGALTDPTAGAPMPSYPWRKYASDVEDRLLGAGKRVARLGQQIGSIPKVVGLPGLAEGTDALFGLPKGASWQATEPTTPGQAQVGDYITNLALMAGGEAAGEVAAAGTGQAAGRAMEDLGTSIQKTVDTATKAKASAPLRILMRGHPIQAAMALGSRLGASLSAKGLETLGQFVADDPDAAGKLAEIGEKATSGGFTLNAPQGNFIVDVMNQLNSGRALSGAQRGYITSIYRTMPK